MAGGTNDKTALLVIDVQNDFCPGGALAVADGDAVTKPINQLTECFNAIVFTQDWHPADHTSFAANHSGKDPFSIIDLPYGSQVLWPSHCVQGSAGAEFVKGLNVTAADLIIRKGFRADIDSYSAFFENDRTTSTGLAGYLGERGITDVVLAGLALDYCVAYSAIDAARKGFGVVVVKDACRAIDLDGSLDAAMRDMSAAGVAFSNIADFTG